MKLKEKAKERVKSLIKNSLSKFGYKITRKSNFDLSLDDVIDQMLGGDNFFFVQVGANDGVMNDPIYHVVTKGRNIRGILLEPIEEYFQKLKENYSSKKDSLIFVNRALYSEDDQEITLYKIDSDAKGIEDWMKGIASINPEHYKRTGKVKDEWVKGEKVKTITWKTLFKQYGVDNIDLLLLDTEGYDYTLLKMFPFDELKPKVIQFEHGLEDGVMSKKQLGELLALLVERDYFVHINHLDAICWLPR